MASGSYSDYALYGQLKGIELNVVKMRLINSTGTVIMSDILTFTWNSMTEGDTVLEMNTSTPKVFTISQAGTVNAIQFLNSSNAVLATVDITAVVYATPTYYTLSAWSFVNTSA